ncbi:MAG: hypothetical protein Q4A42_02785 [Tissierellia bacterium]|nr:hypothetical protein [Tissierellia bacterium]
MKKLWIVTFPVKKRKKKGKKKSNERIKESINELIEPIFFLKRIGFSFEEIGMLTRDEAIDILEMYIEELEQKTVSRKEIFKLENHAANQEDINNFFR